MTFQPVRVRLQLEGNCFGASIGKLWVTKFSLNASMHVHPFFCLSRLHKSFLLYCLHELPALNSAFITGFGEQFLVLFRVFSPFQVIGC